MAADIERPPQRKPGPAGSAWFYAFSRLMVLTVLRIFWRYRVIGGDAVPATGPLIVACNHVSYFDPPALGCALKRPVHYMAKKELFDIPVLGPIIARLFAFPVDRSRGDVGALKRFVEELKTGAACGIFPEGTRNKDGNVKAQSGVALIHSLTGVPIVPAYVDGSAHAGKLHAIKVVLGEPFTLEPSEPGAKKASREDLAKWTSEIMTRIYALRERLGAD